MMVSIELIADYSCEVGENPIWHSDEKRLYWLDIPQGKIFRYDPQHNQHEIFYHGNVIGGMTIQQDGSLLLFMEQGRIVSLKNGKLTPIINSITAEANNCFNDVITSPLGAVFSGTLSNLEDGFGNVYYLDCGGSIRPVIQDVGIANGMRFSPDLSAFYFTDSNPARKIYRYRYNQDVDVINNPEALVSPAEEDGFPDGMTVDVDGFIWSACWDGGKLIRYTSFGAKDMEIHIPNSQKVSSVTFGGDDYSDMYVTTAGGNDKTANGKDAGALFRIQVEGIRGKLEYQSSIPIAE